MKIVEVAMDINIRPMAPAGLMGKENGDTAQLHNGGVTGKVPTHVHIFFQRLVIMITSHQDFPPRQREQPLHSLGPPGAVAQMDHRIRTLHHLAPVLTDKRCEICRPPAAADHGLMVKVCICYHP